MLLNKQPKPLIGYVALNGDEKSQSRDLGYCILSSQQNMGYGYEACSAVLGYAFNALGLCNISSGTAIENTPSIRLLEKLHFQKTGEETVFLRSDDNGRPIHFTGGTFLLSKDIWQQNEA